MTLAPKPIEPGRLRPEMDLLEAGEGAATDKQDVGSVDLQEFLLRMLAAMLFTTGRARLLDHDRLVAQFAGLVRTTSTGGRDKVDNGKNGSDDLCNAAAGALVAAVAGRSERRLHAIGIPSAGSPAWSNVHPKDEVPNTGSSIGLGYDGVRGWH